MEHLDFSSKMARVLKAVREVTGSDFPAQQLAVFMDIASHPETSVGMIGKRLDLPASSVSRAVAALTNWSWTKKSGYGLVEKVEDMYESRRKLVRLTQQGTQLVNQMQAAFEEVNNAKKGTKS